LDIDRAELGLSGIYGRNVYRTLPTEASRAVRIYIWLYIALALYAFAPGLFWGGGSLGKSIAAASEVGGLGIAPLTLFPFPFVYAVISVVLVTFVSKKIGDRFSADVALPSSLIGSLLRSLTA